MPSSLSPQPQQHSRRSRNHACTACKQMKIRCLPSAEAVEDPKHYHPCQRCKANELQCEVDSSFKRLPARQRVKDLEAEVSRLRQTIVQQRQQQAQLPSTAFPYPAIGASNPGQSSRGSYQEPFSSASSHSPNREFHSASLGSFTITQAEIDNCFNVYRKFFHPQLPILNVEIPAEVLRRCSPCLFWTIIAVTLHYCVPEQDKASNLEMRQQYSKLLQSNMLDAPLSLHSIQAIVIICTWPLSMTYPLGDPSWLYLGVASAAARYLNLEGAASRPQYHGGQLSDIDMDISSRTSLALFIMSTSIAIYIGMLSTQQIPARKDVIEAAIKNPNTPRRLAANASISLTMVNYWDELGLDPSPGEHQALIEKYCHRLSHFDNEFADTWDGRLAMIVAAGETHLYASLLVRERKPDGSNPYIQTALEKGSAAACKGLEHFAEIVRRPFSGSQSPEASALPKSLFRHIISATFFLLIFAYHEQKLAPVLKERVRRCTAMSVTALREWSSRPNDETAEASQRLQVALSHSEDWRTHQLSINDRDSASIMWSGTRTISSHRPKQRFDDLLELIDPTRTLQEADCHATPASVGMGDDCLRDLAWDDAIFEYFDFGMFDLIGPGGAV